MQLYRATPPTPHDAMANPPKASDQLLVLHQHQIPTNKYCTYLTTDTTHAGSQLMSTQQTYSETGVRIGRHLDNSVAAELVSAEEDVVGAFVGLRGALCV